MRYLIACTMLLMIAVTAFAAPGDKTAAAIRFHNLSSSTKSAKAAGEMRYNASYIFINVSTVARPHWRRVSLGGSF
jgi:hypothetical protein